MQKQEDLPIGGLVQIKAIIRNFNGKGSNQIFGVVISGIEHLDIQDGDTVMIAGTFVIADGIKAIDSEKWKSAMSREYLMCSLI